MNFSTAEEKHLWQLGENELLNIADWGTALLAFPSDTDQGMEYSTEISQEISWEDMTQYLLIWTPWASLHFLHFHDTVLTKQLAAKQHPPAPNYIASAVKPPVTKRKTILQDSTGAKT